MIAEKIYAGNVGKTLGTDGYINLTTIMLGNAMMEETSNSDFWEHYHTLELLDYHGLYSP